MPSYNLGQIMSLVTSNLGHRADIPSSTASLYINRAYMLVAEDAPPTLLEKCAFASAFSGNYRIVLPSDFAEPIALSLHVWSSSTTNPQIDSVHTLSEIDLSEIASRGTIPSGEPQRFAFFNNEIQLWPSPNSDYSMEIQYRSNTSDLISVTDVPSMATPWREQIVVLGTALLADYVQWPEKKQQALQEYQINKIKLKTDEAKRQLYRGSHRGVSPMYRTVRYR